MTVQLHPSKMSTMYCLYQITNLVNGKYYIGVHRDATNAAYMGSGTAIRAAIRNEGIHNFRRDVLVKIESERMAYMLEEVVVDRAFVALKDTYNLTVGGRRPPASIGGLASFAAKTARNEHPFRGHSANTEKTRRKKISKTLTGRKKPPRTPEHIQHICEKRIGRPWSVDRWMAYAQRYKNG